jgi:hypothetical protein
MDIQQFNEIVWQLATADLPAWVHCFAAHFEVPEDGITSVAGCTDDRFGTWWHATVDLAKQVTFTSGFKS